MPLFQSLFAITQKRENQSLMYNYSSCNLRQSLHLRQINLSMKFFNKGHADNESQLLNTRKPHTIQHRDDYLYFPALPTPLPKPDDLPDFHILIQNALLNNPHAIVPDDLNDILQRGIYFHEKNQLNWAAYYFSESAATGSPLGLVLYALHLRHGWGVPENKQLSAIYLQKAADSVLGGNMNPKMKQQIMNIDENGEIKVPSPQNLMDTLGRITAKTELALAFFELAMSFR